MKKYILFRALRAVVSIVIVTTIIYALIFSLIPRRQIFTSDSQYNTVVGIPDKRVVYENNVFERQGYISFLDQGEFTQKVKKIDPDFDGTNTPENKKAANQWLKKQSGNWEVKQLPNKKTFYAVREIPIWERVGNFYRHLIQIDYPWKIHDKANPDLKRYIKLTWDKGNGPALIGSGTEHKYLIYFDKTFPFIHQKIVTLNLGQSYPTFSGRSVTDVITSGQGQNLTHKVTLPNGKIFNTSIDIHTAVYQTPKKQSAQMKRLFSDDYTNVQNEYQDPSMLMNSFIIGVVGVILSYALSIPIAIFLSRHAGQFIDRFGLLIVTLFIALPSLAVIYFDRFIGGAIGIPDSFTTFGASSIKSYILPTIILALLQVPGTVMWIRRYMIDQQSSDYVKFARAKGLSENEISRNHIFKNAMIPISNGIPGSIILAIAGATMTETIFLVPGMGKMLPDAIAAHNNPMVIGITFIFTTLSVLSVLLGDLLMQVIDPRIQLSTSKGGK
ncbi:ABC transporter permease [Pseudolactococcus insecticola]|uniref:Oligopeptidepermease n=1 Tax=Pseudolactococcus insecticola TaxID=2709158 RepID=A0A6A0B5M3_9LACT|nr:ABC transporter permease [Lactococcus insecticola]GFH40690.1 oligopeptidepermease [Lactococcus insecticola]